MAMPMTRRAALAGAAAVSLVPLAAGPTRAEARFSGRQALRWYRRTIGSFDVTVITDGTSRFMTGTDWHAFYDQDGPMGAARSPLHDMLVGDRATVQGCQHPFPGPAHVVKAGDGHRDISLPWNLTI